VGPRRPSGFHSARRGTLAAERCLTGGPAERRLGHATHLVNTRPCGILTRKGTVMPLRDHFHSPLADFASWEELHGLWPGLMAVRLNTLLPPTFRCGVKIHLGTLVELDVGTFEHPANGEVAPQGASGSGAAWAATEPALLLETDELTPPEYE